MAAMIGGSILVLALPLDRCSKAGTTGYKWEQVGGTGDVGLLNGRTCSSTVIVTGRGRRCRGSRIRWGHVHFTG
jgi:hypothetical protein